MTRIILNDVLRNELRNLAEPLELCDAKGRVLAFVTPNHDADLLGPLEPRVSDEELERRARSGEKTYTTAEVIAYLESL